MDETDALHLFAHLSPKVQARLRGMLHVRQFEAGERIFLQDAPPTALYMVVSGRIKITCVTRDGFESLLCVRRPGDYFCPLSIMDGGGHLGTAIAMSEVTLLWADREEFRALCEASPELLSKVHRTCLAEMRQLLKRTEAFAFRSVTERLAIALLAESRRHHVDRDPPHEIRLTQQELAGLVGASRESVSRALGRLARDGVAEPRRGRVIILDQDQLKRLAGETDS